MQNNDPHAERHRLLHGYLVQHGLKSARQRDLIADVFFRAGGHLLVDELLQRVRTSDPRVSQATVYRTMKLLTECGLAEARHFLDGQTRYELSEGSGKHHDHLICTVCGAIIEFVDTRIEELQDRVAREHGFTVMDHKMELYGQCAKCRVAQAS